MSDDEWLWEADPVDADSQAYYRTTVHLTEREHLIIGDVFDTPSIWVDGVPLLLATDGYTVWPDGWPRFVPFPAVQRAADAASVALSRLRDAWLVLRGRAYIDDAWSDR